MAPFMGEGTRRIRYYHHPEIDLRNPFVFHDFDRMRVSLIRRYCFIDSCVH